MEFACFADGDAVGVSGTIQVLRSHAAVHYDKRLFNAIQHGFDRFVPITSDTNDNGFIPRDAPLFDQLFGDGYRSAASWLGEDAFCTCEELDAFHNLLVCHRFPQPPESRTARNT